jgi:hypothetical protein
MSYTAIWARDSLLWVILWYGGMALQIALGIILVEGPAAYGISPIVFKWLMLINPIITGVAGKAGMSPVELARNQNQPED